MSNCIALASLNYWAGAVERTDRQIRAHMRRCEVAIMRLVNKKIAKAHNEVNNTMNKCVPHSSFASPLRIPSLLYFEVCFLIVALSLLQPFIQV